MRIMAKKSSDSESEWRIMGEIWDKGIFRIFYNMNHAQGRTCLGRGKSDRNLEIRTIKIRV
jgi:hypothetical protein